MTLRKSSSASGRLALIPFFLVALYGFLVAKRGERPEIAGMRQPSMATVLEAVVGHWGAVFISVGLLVSVLGAYLAWSLICAEVLFVAAKARDMPKVFSTENQNKVPAAALWLTNIVVQFFVITTYWSQDAFSMHYQALLSVLLALWDNLREPRDGNRRPFESAICTLGQRRTRCEFKW
jgi:amino acid transporter